MPRCRSAARSVGVIIVLLAATGCDGVPEDAPFSERSGTAPDSDSGGLCRAAERSRWVPGPSGYGVSHSYGAVEDEWIGAIAGGDFEGDFVYLLDAAAPHVRVLTAALEPVERFGREGMGPGELRRGSRVATRRANLLKADTTGIYVAGSASVSRFDLSGRFRDRWSVPWAARPLRLWTSGGEVVVAAQTFGARDAGGPGFGGLRVATLTGPPLVEMEAAPPLRAPSGTPWITPDLAVPLGAAGIGCVVTSDGSSPYLVLTASNGSRADTLPIPLPQRAAAPLPDSELRGFLRIPPNEPVPEVTRRRRVSTLLVDPDGHVWVGSYPTPELEVAGLHEVLVVNPDTRSVRTDTVPALPWFFGAPGTYYAVRYDAAVGVHLLDRLVR